jgi:hypothetical protein
MQIANFLPPPPDPRPNGAGEPAAALRAAATLHASYAGVENHGGCSATADHPRMLRIRGFSPRPPFWRAMGNNNSFLITHFLDILSKLVYTE